MSIGMPDIDKYFKVAMSYPVARLQAVMRNQDHSIPMVAAMAAYEIKSPMEIAAKAQQALAQKSTVSIRDKLAYEGEEEKNGMLPDNLMMAMQQQQQGSLPENTGIGRLPAPNMQGMGYANGGIIAFDDGGEVPGYAGENGSFVSSVGDFFGNLMPKEYDDETKQRLNAIDSERRSYAKQLYDIAGPSGRNVKTPEQQAAADKLKTRIEQLDKDFISTKFSKAKTKTEEKPRVSAGANEARISKPYPSDAKPRAVDPTAGQAVTAENANPGFVPTNTLPSAPPTEKRKAPVASGIPTISPADTEQQMADVMSRISGTRDAEIKSQYADLEKKTATGIEALRTERERGKPAGKAYEGLEKELAEEKAATKGKEDKNLQMALVNAGLAIAGGTSRYALENIGKGALVGTKQYMDGLEKLEAAAKERRKMTAMIDEARRAEARGDFKEKNDFETKAFELGISSRKASIDALSKIYDTDKKAAVDIFNRLEQDKHADLRNRETNATTREVYKNRAGGGEYNVLADNARARSTAWAKSPAGELALMKDPGLEDRKYREFLQDEYANRGLPLPSNLTGGATMPGGGILKFLGFEKQ